MEEKIDRIEKAIEQTQKDIKDLVEIVGSIAANMVTKTELTEELTTVRVEVATGFTSLREELVGKINGVQRAVDSGFERQSYLESRVSKIETVLHLEEA